MPDAAAVLTEHDAAVPPPVRSAILPLETRNLVFTAGGRRLIDGIDLRLEAGRRTVIMGPNGAGKSLLLRLLHGLIDPTAGDVHWQGKPADRRVRRRQAMVFQRPVMLRRSVAANMRHALRANGCSRGDAKERTRTWLAHAGLSAFADQPARTLSGGEQQRLAVARALSLEPEVLFLDEPTASLDPSSARAVESIVAAIHRTGTKVLMTTHDLALARRCADEVLFLHRGQLLERQPAERFFADPATEEAAAFLAGRLDW
jgi:tungstate transport system ATP-binding protein